MSSLYENAFNSLETQIDQNVLPMIKSIGEPFSKIIFIKNRLKSSIIK